MAVAANQLFVLGEGHITFHDTCPHTRGSGVALGGVFGELQGSATVTDGKIGALYGLVCARQQLVLQRAVFHLINKIVLIFNS